MRPRPCSERHADNGTTLSISHHGTTQGYSNSPDSRSVAHSLEQQHENTNGYTSGRGQGAAVDNEAGLLSDLAVWSNINPDEDHERNLYTNDIFTQHSHEAAASTPSPPASTVPNSACTSRPSAEAKSSTTGFQHVSGIPTAPTVYQGTLETLQRESKGKDAIPMDLPGIPDGPGTTLENSGAVLATEFDLSSEPIPQGQSPNMTIQGTEGFFGLQTAGDQLHTSAASVLEAKITAVQSEARVFNTKKRKVKRARLPKFALSSQTSESDNSASEEIERLREHGENCEFTGKSITGSFSQYDDSETEMVQLEYANSHALDAMANEIVIAAEADVTVPRNGLGHSDDYSHIVSGPETHKLGVMNEKEVEPTWEDSLKSDSRQLVDNSPSDDGFAFVRFREGTTSAQSPEMAVKVEGNSLSENTIDPVNPSSGIEASSEILATPRALDRGQNTSHDWSTLLPKNQAIQDHSLVTETQQDSLKEWMFIESENKEASPYVNTSHFQEADFDHVTPRASIRKQSLFRHFSSAGSTLQAVRDDSPGADSEQGLLDEWMSIGSEDEEYSFHDSALRLNANLASCISQGRSMLVNDLKEVAEAIVAEHPSHAFETSQTGTVANGEREPHYSDYARYRLSSKAGNRTPQPLSSSKARDARSDRHGYLGHSNNRIARKTSAKAALVDRTTPLRKADSVRDASTATRRHVIPSGSEATQPPSKKTKKLPEENGTQKVIKTIKAKITQYIASTGLDRQRCTDLW